MAVDQRGFKSLIQLEAYSFLDPSQLRLNSTVEVISSSRKGVKVTLTDGTVLTSDYALCTFSLGVLQHDDVRFEPELPVWKQEAIHSMTMVDDRLPRFDICTKITESNAGYIYEDLPAVCRQILV